MSHKEDNNPITVHFPSGRVASSIVDLVVRKKPVGWSRRSVSPYYHEKYARPVKDILDAMMEDKKPRKIPFHPSVSETTMYARYNQGLQYLLQQLDTDGKYARFMSALRPKRVANVGIVLEFPKDVVPDDLLTAEIITPRSETPQWKDDMLAYLDDPSTEGTPFHRDKLVLNEREVEQLKIELAGMANVMVSVTSSEVKLFKGV